MRALSRTLPLLALLCTLALPAQAQQATGEDLVAMLPEQAGGWTRADVHASDERPVLEVTYEQEGSPYSFDLYLSYSERERQQLAGLLAQASEGEVQEVERGGHTLLVLQEVGGGHVGVALQTGELSALWMVCGEATDCTVPDPDAARNELMALVEGFDLDRLAAFGAQEEAPAALRELVPDTLAGLLRGRIQEAPEQSLVAVTYGHEDVPYTVNLRLGAGEVARTFRAGMEEEVNEPNAATEETMRLGQTVYLQRRPEEPSASLIAFPGEMVVMLSALAPAGSTFDVEAALDHFVQAYEELGPDHLAAFTLADAAPEGFTSYRADLEAAELAFVHPDDWTVVNLHRRTGIARGVVAMRDEAAAEELLGGGLALSSGETRRLVTPDNVIVSVALVGAGMAPEAFLDQMAQQPLLEEAEVVQPVSETSVADAPALETHVRGLDADGRPGLLRHLAFTAGGQLVSVSVLHAADAPAGAAEEVQQMLDSLAVTAR